MPSACYITFAITHSANVSGNLHGNPTIAVHFTLNGLKTVIL